MTRVFVFETTSADPRCADAALAAQGRSMRDAMVADMAMLDGLHVGCAVGDPWEPAPSAQVSYLRQTADQSPLDVLRRQAALHDLLWVVAPESGGMLSSLCEAVAHHQWLGCSRRAIDIAGSKRATAELLRSAGIAATEPLDRLAPQAAARGSQWVVKPDDGCGAGGARRHGSYEAARADLDARALRREDAVMEPWIDGEPLSISLLCSGDDAEVLAVNHQRIAFDDAGWLRFEGVSRSALGGRQARDLATLGRRIWRALPGLFGFVGVDVTWHPRRGPVVIEVNPRVTCAYEGLSKRLGRNVAAQLLAVHRRRVGAAAASVAEIARLRRAIRS